MQTERLDEFSINRAAQWLKRGEVIAFPTETVYGLGAPIFNPQAVQQIFLLKGRPADNPLIAHISDLAQVHRLGVAIPAAFYKLAEAFFPGPCTVVLKKHPSVPSIVSAGMDTIALRMPKHRLAQELISLVGEPLVAPSANLSGKPSATTCHHVLEDFEGKIAAVIDGGETELGIESTVISLIDDQPLLLRPGSITQAELEEVLGCSIACVQETQQHTRILSPGMKYRHYCPRTPIALCTTLEELQRAVQAEERPMVLTRFQSLDILHGEHFMLSAKQLYALFRQADAQGYSRILLLCDEELMRDAALRNRILRAACV